MFAITTKPVFGILLLVMMPLSNVQAATDRSTAVDEAALKSDDKAAADLVGVVQWADGQPIEGALVSIYSAGVRVGTSPFCPTCYADCGKRSAAGHDGAFSIEKLDPTLVFRVLVVAKGYKPQFVNKVDPRERKKLTVTLKARPVLPDNRRQVVGGQVVGPDGKPLAGALVEPYGCKTGERRWWGSTPNIDPLTVTNDDGRFEIVSAEPVDGIDLQVSARGMAMKKFALVPPGADDNRLQLTPGAAVRGRLLDRGKPLAGVLVGLVQANRSTEKFYGPLQIGTDNEGRFLFPNVPGNEDYFVYGLMTSLRQRGAVPARQIHLSGDESETDAGDLAVEPAFRIAGRLALSDGKPVPAHTRVLFSREDAWDSQMVQTDAEGKFAAAGIPRGVISITATVPNYRVSEKNKSLERLNGTSLKGAVSGDINDLVVLFESGKHERVSWPTSPSEQRALMRSLKRLKSEPPVGVTADLKAFPESDSDSAQVSARPRRPLPKIDVSPAKKPLPSVDADVPMRTITGRVTGTDGKPIADAEVWFPVRWVTAETYATAHAKCARDGKFELKFPAEWISDDVIYKLSSVWAYAPGHSIGIGKVFKQLRNPPSDEPCEIHLGAPADTNITVLLPDGKPAVGVRVKPVHFLASQGYEYVPPGLLAMTSAITDREGHASLPAYPREKMSNVNVTTDALGSQEFGLNQRSSGAQSELKLSPVGRIEGRVLADQKDLFRDMVLAVETQNDATPDRDNGSGVALLSPDQDGRFVIPHIAAGLVQIDAIIDERLPVRPRLPERDQIEVLPGKTARIDIPLEMAVRVHGVIRVNGSGEPVAGATISVGYGVGRQSQHAKSDRAAKYNAYVLPGNVRMQVIQIPQRGLDQLMESRTAQFPVPDGVADFDLPPIELTKTKRISGRLLNSEGKPLPNRRINGVVGNARYGWGESDKNGDFTLSEVPESIALKQFQIWDENGGPPMDTSVETTEPLVVRAK